MKQDIICFCHLRWDFVFQRPQHLLTRFAKHTRVFVFEEPMFGAAEQHLVIKKDPSHDVWIAVPHLPHGLNAAAVDQALQTLVDKLVDLLEIQQYITWYYSPMPLSFTNHLVPEAIVYDCMDELSAFDNAPAALVTKERELFTIADLVFTGGHHLYQAKKDLHTNIHPMPSSIDKSHFSVARQHTTDMPDQAAIPYPRIGFYGVLDERLNLNLVASIAAQCPDFQFVFIGPVVKINPETLPKNSNIHYLGSKSYKELPVYLGGWDVAMMPFALNRSTEFISPTKTPEYLAGGKQVVSTSIADVKNPYGTEGLVYIADTPEEFSSAVFAALENKDNATWLRKTDQFLAGISWDQTFDSMKQLLIQTIENKNVSQENKTVVYV